MWIHADFEFGYCFDSDSDFCFCFCFDFDFYGKTTVWTTVTYVIEWRVCAK